MTAILLVNLSRTLQSVISHICEDQHARMSSVSSGKDALQLLRDESFDIVITTFELDDMPGDQFCEAIRQTISDTLPVFLITSTEELIEPSSLATMQFTEVYLADQLPLFERHLKKILGDIEQEYKQDGTLLLVEDNQAQQQVFELMLSSLGYSLITAKSYQEACDLLAAHDVDLVLLDIILEGGVSGISFIDYVRTLQGPKCHIPILVMSAYQAASRTIEIYRMGANDFLQKPFSQEILTIRVANLVQFKKAQDKIHEQELSLRYLAMHDALTGLHNRRYFIESCNQAIAEASRQNYPLTLLVLDIDHFKKVNDEQGHLVGDEVLSAVADILKSNCRTSDICARLGGEEFTVLHSFCDETDAVRKSEALRQQIAEHEFACGKMTVSIGITTLNETHRVDSFKQLFAEADMALYQAKHKGRNRVLHYLSLNESAG